MQHAGWWFVVLQIFVACVVFRVTPTTAQNHKKNTTQKTTTPTPPTQCCDTRRRGAVCVSLWLISSRIGSHNIVAGARGCWGGRIRSTGLPQLLPASAFRFIFLLSVFFWVGSLATKNCNTPKGNPTAKPGTRVGGRHLPIEKRRRREAWQQVSGGSPVVPFLSGSPSIGIAP